MNSAVMIQTFWASA